MGLSAQPPSGTPQVSPGRNDERAPTVPAALPWVPIRALGQRQRPRMLAHLLGLPAPDRYLRFGYAAGDEQVARYVDSIDFERDDVFGIHNRRLELIGLAHLAALPGGREAEFGVSVSPSARGRGYGARLFDHATLHARNRGLDTLVIHALSENTTMLHIAAAAGAKLERAGGDAQARLRLPPDTIGSHLEALLEDGAAEIDYRLKREARRIATRIGGNAGGPTR
jgi:ribosomal protein S18 acetylase RimI-like enzyme